jgi:hypothetical protein
MRYIMEIRKLSWLIPVVLLTGFFWSCEDSDGGEEFNKDTSVRGKGGEKALSSANAITAFRFDSIVPPVVGTINETERSITVKVGFGTDLKSLVPTITISAGASIDPASGVARNFEGNAPLKYTVKAQDGTTAEWAVTVKFNALTSIEDVKAYLGVVAGGANAGAPVPLPVSINLGWTDLLTAIQEAGKYVDLDISACKMAGTEFDPNENSSTGKNLVVSLVLPNAAESLKSGSYNANAFNFNAVFKFFSSLKSVSGSNIKTIPDSAFISCTTVTTVNFPEATSIGNRAFYGCDALIMADFPKVTSISSQAFASCDALTTANFPEAVSIGMNGFGGAFEFCKALITVDFPKAVSIGKDTFTECTSLTTVNFPVATSIGAQAFVRCAALTTVNLPKVTSFYNNAFRETGTGALAITLPKAAPEVAVDSSYLYSYSKTVTIKRPADSTGYDDTWQTKFKNAFSSNSTIALKFENM